MKDVPDEKAKDFDVVLLHSATDDGRGVRVLRARPDKLEAGEVRPMEEGKPLAPSAEIVTLAPREGSPRVCDVKTVYAPPEASSTRSGPPQVATTRFRDNWDAIFGDPRAEKSKNALS